MYRIYTDNDSYWEDEFKKQFLKYLIEKKVYANQEGFSDVLNNITGVELLDNKLDSITTDEKGRFKHCPRCGNTSFSDEARYCKICGQFLFNKCTNDSPTCGKISPGDARYCEICGFETTLSKDGLLKSWNELKNNKETIKINNKNKELIDFTLLLQTDKQ